MHSYIICTIKNKKNNVIEKNSEASATNICDTYSIPDIDWVKVSPNMINDNLKTNTSPG